MDFKSCNSAAQFAVPQSQNTFVIPNITPFNEFGLNMIATSHVGLTIKIFDVTQTLSFVVFNRAKPLISAFSRGRKREMIFLKPLFLSLFLERCIILKYDII